MTTEIQIEQTQVYKDWAKRLDELNDYINSLEVWDNHAEESQSRYDRLLSEDPRLKK